MDYLQKEIQEIQNAVKSDVSQNGEAHVQLLEAIHKLNLAVEKPMETLMRLNYQVLYSFLARVILAVDCHRA